MATEVVNNQQYSKNEKFENNFCILDDCDKIPNNTQIECVGNLKDEVYINETFENDSIIAQMLQEELDKEYNGTNQKTSLRALDLIDINVEIAAENGTKNDEEEIELTDLEDEDNFDDIEQEYKIQKHKSKLSNNVFNDLKRLSNHKLNKNYTFNSRDKTMTELCMNQFIDSSLEKIVNVTGIIDYGKDSVIFHAYSNPSFPHSLPKECAIKVHKSILSEFKQWEKFIKEDHYFKTKFNKRVTKETLQKKVHKEKDILMKLQKIDWVKCPKVVTLKNGVLVTSFIGKNKKPAPKLKDAIMTRDESMNAYHKVICTISKMYSANVIHCGLSEHNILWYNKHPYIINVGHCLERSQPEGFNTLFRSCVNISNFFAKKNGVTYYPECAFGDIVQCCFDEKVSLEKLRKSFEKEKD